MVKQAILQATEHEAKVTLDTDIRPMVKRLTHWKDPIFRHCKLVAVGLLSTCDKMYFNVC